MRAIHSSQDPAVPRKNLQAEPGAIHSTAKADGYGNGSARAVCSGYLKLVNPNFTGIRGDAHGVIGKGVKKRRLDVPNIAFLDAGIHHHWTSEMTFKRGDTSSLDPVWPIYGVLDLTREGRGDSAAYPNLQY